MRERNKERTGALLAARHCIFLIRMRPDEAPRQLPLKTTRVWLSHRSRFFERPKQ